jgi:hypothetical protein
MWDMGSAGGNQLHRRNIFALSVSAPGQGSRQKASSEQRERSSNAVVLKRSDPQDERPVIWDQHAGISREVVITWLLNDLVVVLQLREVTEIPG